MTKRSSERWPWIEDVLPFVAMLVLTCLDISLVTVIKAAMNDGMESIVYVVYHNALGTMMLLPFFIFHIFRNNERPPLTLHLLFRFFILGLFGFCLQQVLLYEGVAYSSPTMSSAISNLAPVNTFLLAVVFRLEKINIRSSSSQAKLLGTIIAISGAMVFTFYQGPQIFHTIRSPDLATNFVLSQPSDWVVGGLIIVVAMIASSIWSVLQSATAREFPDQQTIVFFYCLFGTMLCILLSPFLEPDPSAWVLQPGIGITAVLFGAVYSTMIRNTVLTWCLEKKGAVFVAMFSPMSIVIAIIMGITFLGDSLHLGSAIGATIIGGGFYSVMWGQAKEKNKLLIEEDLVVAGSSNHNTTPLLSSTNESKC